LYSLADLLEDARRLGFPAFERRFRDWQEAYVLSRGRRPGRGQRRGRGEAQYTEEERQFFLALLTERKSGASIPELQDRVVREWLHRNVVVSTKQAMGAARLWARWYGRPSQMRARERANAIVAEAARPCAQPADIRRAERALAHFLRSLGQPEERLWDELVTAPRMRRQLGELNDVRERRRRAQARRADVSSLLSEEAVLVEPEPLPRTTLAELRDALSLVGDPRPTLERLAARLEALRGLVTKEYSEAQLVRARGRWQLRHVQESFNECDALDLFLEVLPEKRGLGSFARSGWVAPNYPDVRTPGPGVFSG
jgi:hypothetical protein